MLGACIACVVCFAADALIFRLFSPSTLSLRKQVEWSNTWICILFQVYFINMAVYAAFLGSYDAYMIIYTVYYHVVGYFLYDSCHLLMHDVRGKYMYLAHHTVTIGITLMFVLRPSSTLSAESPGLWFHIVFPIAGEIPNPVLNLRKVCAMVYGFESTQYNAVYDVAILLYAVCRIFGFPVIFWLYAPIAFEMEPLWAAMILYAVATGLYIVSVGWFKTMIAGRRGGQGWKLKQLCAGPAKNREVL